jgi:ferredoxin
MRMNTEIFYFSGTGNSLHIAKELQKKIPGSRLISMLKVLGSGALQRDADVIGFIFPIHCLTIPLCVRDFFACLLLKDHAYTFAIASRECSVKVFHEINRLFSPKNKNLDACFSIQMPQTYLPVFDVDSPGEVQEKESALILALDNIKDSVMWKKTVNISDPGEPGMFIYYMVRPFLIFLFHKTRYFNLEHRFYADEKCTGCGTCARICLSKKIQISGERPVWNKDIKCLFCFACIHYCPARAIQIKKSKTISRGRYHHPQISPREIMEQKS